MAATPDELLQRLAERRARREGSPRAGLGFSGAEKPYSEAGIQDYALRREAGFADNPQELQRVLDEQIGTGLWSTDPRGRVVVSPEGAAKFGVTVEKPVLLDEPRLTFADIADVQGDLPAIAGAVAGGMAAVPGPHSWITGPLLAALGAAGGKGYQEAFESLTGRNVESAGEVAKDLAGEGLAGAAGEGIARGGAAVARKVLGPRRHAMTESERQLMAESRDLGMVPQGAAVTKAPILGRSQSMLDMVFGNPREAANSAAIKRELDRLKSSFGTGVTGRDVGTTVKKSIRDARQSVTDWADEAYARLDQLAGGEAIVSTANLKMAARSVVKDRAIVDSEGAEDFVFTSPEIVALVRKIESLPDKITFAQAKNYRTDLRTALGDETLLPGVSDHYKDMFLDALTKDIEQVDDAADPAFQEVWRMVNQRYKTEIDRFNDAFILRLTKDKKFAGTVEPEEVARAIFKPNNESKIQRVMLLMPESTRKSVRRIAMERLLLKVVDQGDDPVITQVFNGKRFRRALLDYEDGGTNDTLAAMFGSNTREELYRLARQIQFVEQRQKASGGIVVANIALHPITKFPKIMQLRILSKFMNSPTGLKWLTEGFELPVGTRKGAALAARIAIQLQSIGEQMTKGSPRLKSPRVSITQGAANGR